MGPNFLVREIAVAFVGAAGVWALNASPLQNGALAVLRGAVIAATVLVMARMGGLL